MPGDAEVPAPSPRDPVVVVHGLNTRSDVMDELVGVLERAGLLCVRVSLYSEAITSRSRPAEVVDAWSAAIEQGIDRAARLAPDRPVSVVAFSVGALATIRLLDIGGTECVGRLCLLAPPVSLRRAARLVRWLTPLWRLGLGLPSAAPRSVRQRRWTPFNEYRALLAMHDDMQATFLSDRLRSTPSLICVHPRDELVSAAGVKNWVDRRRLPEWTVEVARDRSSAGRGPRHLLVTRAALGDDAWTTMTDRMVGFLR